MESDGRVATLRPFVMDNLQFSILICVGSVLAGLLGALTGLGGGTIIIPMLVLLFKVDLHYAIGAALVSVIATSSGAASAYVRDGYSNTRVGMFLEVATTFGALCGAAIAVYISGNSIAIIFGVVLLYSAWLSLRPRKEQTGPDQPDRFAVRLKMDSSYPTPDGPKDYHVHHLPGGFVLMWVAGVLSGLLGIGSGAIKVLAMDSIMKLPFKVSTTTSNFMIGVTAAASAGVYLNRGYIDPALAMPVMLGVLVGALWGARVLVHAKVQMLRIVFSAVIVFLALEMMYQGITGKL